jgi:hypothetical protein
VDITNISDGPAIIILRVAEVNEEALLNKGRLLKRSSTVLRSYSNTLRGEQ